MRASEHEPSPLTFQPPCSIWRPGTMTKLMLRIRKPSVRRTHLSKPMALPKGVPAVLPTPSARATPDTPPDTSPDTWSSFATPDNYLRLSHTLQSGQVFRWKHTGEHEHVQSPSGRAEEWIGSIENRLFVLRQAVPRPPLSNPDPVWYRHITASTTGVINKDTEADAVLRDYFRADDDFREMYKAFCATDEKFANVFPYFNGLRCLRQSPEECFFAFICSSNNHIKRISKMVTTLAEEYGCELGCHDGKVYHSFPTTENLAKQTDERTLRELGFGYRAKFIASSSQSLTLHAEREGITVSQLLQSWRKLKRIEVAKNLTRYPGIGRKVAGCIALMSLDQLGEIPVDTHVWQIAKRDLPHLQTKSLTLRVYEDVGIWFRERFGEDIAGIAHNFLFVGELPEFQKLLPPHLRKVDDARKRSAKK